MSIFEGKKPALPFSQSADANLPPPPPRYNTVSSQCELDSAYMDLCDVLIRSQQTGVLTVQHARERRAVQLWADKLFLDLRLEEKYQRDRVMGERRDQLELMRTMLLALAPTTQLYPSTTGRHNRLLKGRSSGALHGSVVTSEGGRDLSPSARMSASLQSFSPNASVQLQGNPLTLAAPGSRSQDVERLQERIAELERQLAHKMKLDWLVAPQTNTLTLISNLPRDIEQELRDMISTFTRLEQQERGGIAEREEESFAALVATHQLAYVERQLIEQRRFLVHTPYEAYRPRIPLQHSLKGEDFLRRWLMAETFKHYEDVIGQLQDWENHQRCDIEDEAFSTVPLLKANAFEPLYKERCAELEEEVIGLRYHKIVHERDASVHASAAKIKLLFENEERARLQTMYYERLDWERIAEVASSLAVLKDVQKTVVYLRGELQRTTTRHREEMLGLHQHLTALDAEGRAQREHEAARRLEAYHQTAFVRGDGNALYETLALDKQSMGPLRPTPPPPPTATSQTSEVQKEKQKVRPSPKQPSDHQKLASKQQQALKDAYLSSKPRAPNTGASNRNGSLNKQPSGNTTYWAGF